jgi:hypothetical protein
MLILTGVFLDNRWGVNIGLFSLGLKQKFSIFRKIFEKIRIFLFHKNFRKNISGFCKKYTKFFAKTKTTYIFCKSISNFCKNFCFFFSKIFAKILLIFFTKFLQKRKTQFFPNICAKILSIFGQSFVFAQIFAKNLVNIWRKSPIFCTKMFVETKNTFP